MRRRIYIGPLAVAVLALADNAFAQVDRPIGHYVADARISWVRFKADAGIASAIGINAANLPTRGLGLSFGLHWYPIRRRSFAVGIGGEFLTAQDTRTLEPTTEDGPEGPTVETTFSSLAPQLSLNFGKRDGWSYISGGIGSASFTAQRVDSAVGEGDRARTINYGGGARWFTSKHLAVSVDLRFYSIAAQPATATRPAFPKNKTMVITGGIALR